MSTSVGFQTQITSIMEVLSKAAVAEICKLVDEGYAVLQLEISRSRQENEILKQKLSIQMMATGAAQEIPANENTIPSSAGIYGKPPGPRWRDGTAPVLDRVSEIEEERPNLLLVKEEDLASADSLRELNIIEESFAELEAAEKPGKADAVIGTAEDVKGLGAWDDGGLGAALKAEVGTELEDHELHHARPGLSAERRSCPESEVSMFDKPALEMCYAENSALEQEDPAGSEGDLELFSADTVLPHLGPFNKPLWFTDQNADLRKKHYDCDYCRKSFSSSQSLEVHLRVHTGEKPFKCAHCGKRFAQLCNLITHRRVHTGEKPFHCIECGKRFADPGYLKRHQSVHTGEKPFICQECGRSFSFSSNLARHRSLHARKDPLNCKRGAKKFISTSHT